MPTEPRGAKGAAAPSTFGLFPGWGGAETVRSGRGTEVAAVILLALDLPLTLGLLPAGTDVDSALGVLDLAAALVARAGRSSATSASNLVL